MRVGIVVDSTCDLPPDFVGAHCIRILPNAIRLKDGVIVDERDPQATLAFYTLHAGDKSRDAETAPLSVEEIQQVFLERLVLDFDYVLCIPAWKERSQVHDNATKASLAILSRYHAYRQRAGADGHFSMRVIDSGTISTGAAVLAAHAAQAVRERMAANDIRIEIEHLVPNVVHYFVPADLSYIRKRALKRGEKSVGLAAFVVANLFEITPIIAIHGAQSRTVATARGRDAAVTRLLEHVTAIVRDAELLSSHICVSYGGDPASLRALPAYDALESACAQRAIQLLLSRMSVASAVAVGPGALAIAYAGSYRDIR